MNILTGVTGPEPAGAVALLERGDPAELERFRLLEDRVWDATTPTAAVIEAARIRSARIRGCEFCASVRMSGAAEVGLSEQQLSAQEDPEERERLPQDQRAALRLVDAFLLEAATPPADEREWLIGTLGPEGVVEVLLACSVFASADLRIALGDNRAANSTVIPRAHAVRPRTDDGTRWPALAVSILLPDTSIPGIDPRIDAALRGLRTWMFEQDDVPDRLLSACLLRCAQLLGVEDDGPRERLLAPESLRSDVRGHEVRDWTRRLTGDERALMTYAEQLWLDPSGLDEPVVGPVRSVLGDAALIRHTWRLIWIAQLQRMSMVLGPEEAT